MAHPTKQRPVSGPIRRSLAHRPARSDPGGAMNDLAPLVALAFVLACPMSHGAAAPRGAPLAEAPWTAEAPPHERLPLAPRANEALSLPAPPTSPTAAAARERSTDAGSDQAHAVEAPPLLLARPESPQANSGAGAEVEAPRRAAERSAIVPEGRSNAATGERARWPIEDLLLGTLLPVGVVAIVAVALRSMLLRGRGRSARPGGVIEVLARHPLGRGQQIVLLRVGRRVIAAHQADRAMGALCETSDPDEVAELIERSHEGGRESFARLLARRGREADPFEGAEMVDLTRRQAARGLAEPRR